MVYKFYFGEDIDLTRIVSISDVKEDTTSVVFKNNPYSGKCYTEFVLENGVKIKYNLPSIGVSENTKKLEVDKDSWKRFVRNK